MRTIILLLTIASTAFAAGPRLSVVADTNSALVWPTNFFTVNRDAIIDAVGNGITSSNLNDLFPKANHRFHISPRTDGKDGTGSQSDPFDVSTPTKVYTVGGG